MRHLVLRGSVLWCGVRRQLLWGPAGSPVRSTAGAARATRPAGASGTTLHLWRALELTTKKFELQIHLDEITQ